MNPQTFRPEVDTVGRGVLLILPDIDKVIIEPDTVSLMPYMPLGSNTPAVSERPPTATGPAVQSQGGAQ